MLKIFFNSNILKRALVLVLLACAYYVAHLTLRKENYFIDEMPITPSVPLKIFTNSCNIDFQVCAYVASPKVFMFYYINYDESSDLSSSQTDPSRNIVSLYGNSDPESCLIRVLLPLNTQTFNDLEIMCKKECHFNLALPTSLKLSSFAINADTIYVYMTDVSIGRLSVSANYFIYNLNFSDVGLMCVDATTFFINLNQKEDYGEFAYYLTGPMDVEKIYGEPKLAESVAASALPGSCDFQNFELQLTNFKIAHNQMSHPNNPEKFSDDVEIQKISYGSPRHSRPPHVFFVYNFSINFQNQKKSLEDEPLDTFSPVSKAADNDYTYLPSIEPEIEKVMQEFKKGASNDAIITLVFRFNDVYNQEKRKLLGVYIFQDLGKFLISLFLKKQISILSESVKVAYIDISVFRKSNDDDPLRLAEVYLTIKNEVQAFVEEAISYESRINQDMIGLLPHGKFYYINIDSR